MNNITKTMLILLMLCTAAIAAGCGEKEIEPTLVGNWQLDVIGLSDGNFIHIDNSQGYSYCSMKVNDSEYGEGFGFMNIIGYIFKTDSTSVYIRCLTEVFAEGLNAQLFNDYLPEMNRYELKLNELKIYSADSTRKYLLYHKINN